MSTFLVTAKSVQALLHVQGLIHNSLAGGGDQAELEGLSARACSTKHLTWTRFAPNWGHFCPPAGHLMGHLTRFALNLGHFCPLAGALYVISSQIESTWCYVPPKSGALSSQLGGHGPGGAPPPGGGARGGVEGLGGVLRGCVWGWFVFFF